MKRQRRRTLTGVPGGSADPSAWLRGQTFEVAGFGDDGRGDMSDHLHVVTAERAVFQCPRGSGGWEFGDAHKLCVESADGSGTRRGDSGGPQFWTSPAGRRYQVGV